MLHNSTRCLKSLSEAIQKDISCPINFQNNEAFRMTNGFPALHDWRNLLQQRTLDFNFIRISKKKFGTYSTLFYAWINLNCLSIAPRGAEIGTNSQNHKWKKKNKHTKMVQFRWRHLLIFRRKKMFLFVLHETNVSCNELSWTFRTNSYTHTRTAILLKTWKIGGGGGWYLLGVSFSNIWQGQMAG